MGNGVASRPAAWIRGIRYHLPEERLDNHELAAALPGWSADEIEAKTGIAVRRIASATTTASDLACSAAEALLTDERIDRGSIDYLLFCTQAPDYFLPTTACMLQHRLGLGRSCGALDFNLGCSGFVYGLSLAKGLIESRQARRVLLLTADTYSKFIDPADRSVRVLFGDGAAATLLDAEPGGAEHIGPFVLGTDGSGAENLIIREGAARHLRSEAPARLQMNGPDVLAFTLSTVPSVLDELLHRSGETRDSVDLFVFHQANGYLLEQLERKCAIPSGKSLRFLRECGNTVSSTIPIALHEADKAGRLPIGARVAVIGFGVGYSWGAAMVTWRGNGGASSTAGGGA